MHKKILGLFLFMLICIGQTANAQYNKLDEKAEKLINYYFLIYQPKGNANHHPYRMLGNNVDVVKKKITIEVDEHFSDQEFSKKNVKKIYKQVGKYIPKKYREYKLEIKTNNIAIEKLIPGYESENGTRSWGNIEYKGNPWVKNMSQPHKISHGLANKHISLWASHGMYYDQRSSAWKWQRPQLFGTTEDLFTPTIVVPYLIPMLEKAGANVFTPRERDLQTAEVIVDNDNTANGVYQENNQSTQWVAAPGRGFGQRSSWLVDGENPFTHGTARMTLARKSKKNNSSVSYQPNIPKEGQYAVYVSYSTVDGSIDDAEYTVYHQGQKTVFHVNQQMGGNTWVYLGTFSFDQGCNSFNRVVLSNKSKRKGIVTTDAVRFGGGMGNIRRGLSTSGMPRALEGARYSAQWSGVPYSVYSSKRGQDDYSDDINVRSLMTNWLAGGSVFLPSKEGKKVPLELALAIHSDAGYSKNKKDLIGSLAICTTNFNDGKLNSGVSRMMSHNFADMLLKGIERDIHQKYGRWNIRDLYDRNYSETRMPEIPSAILETLSHQNFPDMLYGQDPNFKMTLARSIYKTILRFISTQHGKPYIVVPLAPIHFRMEMIGKNKVRLQWDKQDDMSEPTAKATAYNVYTATGFSDFDNGQTVKKTYFDVELEPGKQYNFRITAVNRGGESFPTETLSAYYQPNAKATILVVNGFHRLATPAVVNTADQQGFDFITDPGVANGKHAGWVGKQTHFDTRTMGKEGFGGLGYGENEWQGQVMTGNTFDYVKTHTEAIAATREYSVVSASSKAVESGQIDMTNYPLVDLILGLEKNDAHALANYKTFSPIMRQKINDFLNKKGRLMVSGAYISTDMQGVEEQAFLSNTLKLQHVGAKPHDVVLDGNQGLALYREMNDSHYAVSSTDIFFPLTTAFAPLTYSHGGAAAVAYIGNDYTTFTLGFPFEAIKDQQQRMWLMRRILATIMNQQ